jgi:accessory gene regulator protein AgrB
MRKWHKSLSVDAISYNLSGKISLILGLDETHRQVVKYGLTVLISNVFGLTVVLIIAYFLDIFIPTIAVASTLLVLRPSAGGAHCGNPLNCNVFGLLFMPLLGYSVLLILGLPITFKIALLCVSLSWRTVVAITGVYMLMRLTSLRVNQGLTVRL